MKNFLFRGMGFMLAAMLTTTLVTSLEARDFEPPVRWTGGDTSGQLYGFLGLGAALGFDVESRLRRTWFDASLEISGSVAPGYHEAEVLAGVGYTPRMFRFGIALGAESYGETLSPSDLERLQGANDVERYSGPLGQVSLGWAKGYVDVTAYLRSGPQGAGGGVALDVWYPYSRRWVALINLDISSSTRGGFSMGGFAAMAYRNSALTRVGFGLVFAGTEAGFGVFAVTGF